MDIILEKLIELKKIIIDTKYSSSSMWEDFLNHPPYNNFYLAFINEDKDSMEKILYNYKREYKVEFASPTILDINLLNKYNIQYNTNYTKDSSELSNISNFGIGDINDCNIATNDIVINSLSVRYYFTYLMLSTYIKPNINILEIGCNCPAGVASNILKYKKQDINCILLCDLYPVLLITYATLLYNFPNLKIHFYKSTEKSEDVIKNNDIVLIIPNHLNNFQNCSIEFCFNSYSFSEMSIDNLNNYFNFLTKTTKYIISENKHKENNGSFIALLDIIPNNFVIEKQIDNINSPDGNHNIICFKNSNL